MDYVETWTDSGLSHRDKDRWFMEYRFWIAFQSSSVHTHEVTKGKKEGSK